MSKKITRRQEEILKYIQESIYKRGYPPSVREIGEAIGLKSSSTVHSHLVKLEKLGYIRRDPTKPRAIELIKACTSTIKVPVVGRVAAGEPILAIENIEDIFLLPDIFANSSDKIFMLTIRGDSMINAGILDGDYIIVRQQNTAENGDIVVALLGDTATVKRFYREGNYIRLQPENDALEPIYTKDVAILGKVIGLLRKID